MPAESRLMLLEEIENVKQASIRQFEEVKDRFTRTAEEFGVDPSLVISDPFGSADAEVSDVVSRLGSGSHQFSPNNPFARRR